MAWGLDMGGAEGESGLDHLDSRLAANLVGGSSHQAVGSYTADFMQTGSMSAGWQWSSGAAEQAGGHFFQACTSGAHPSVQLHHLEPGTLLWNALLTSYDHRKDFLAAHVFRSDGNGILGRVKNHVIRYEVQDHGSLHAHIILWLEPLHVDRVATEITACIPAALDADTNLFMPPSDPQEAALFALTPRGVKAGTRGGGRGPLHNRSNRELWRKVWQDLPDVDTLFDADEMESILESFYEADLSNELAPGAADFDVSCDEVEATHVFNLKDDFFDVSHQSIVLPTAIDMSLRPTSEPVCHYDAAAEVDRVLSGM
ncbi:TPA: hypothetical protein ACH3X1_002177 [Trebouxia sp. C0004]